MSIVASIICKWKKFVLPRAGRPANREGVEEFVVTEVTKTPVVTLTELSVARKPSRRITISAALYQSGVFGSMARKAGENHTRDQKPLTLGGMNWESSQG